MILKQERWNFVEIDILSKIVEKQLLLKPLSTRMFFNTLLECRRENRAILSIDKFCELFSYKSNKHNFNQVKNKIHNHIYDLLEIKFNFEVDNQIVISPIILEARINNRTRTLEVVFSKIINRAYRKEQP